MPRSSSYLPIGDYGLIGDCHSSALVSLNGSIDWCCLPRFDSGSTFGRLLDHRVGGHCTLAPVASERFESSRYYLENTLVLATTFTGSGGEAQLIDCFLVGGRSRQSWQREILRVFEVKRGTVDLDVRVAPRFDYGEVRPWVRRHSHHMHSAIGGNDALLVWSEQELEEDPEHELVARLHLTSGERFRLLLAYSPPELVSSNPPEPEPEDLDRQLDATIRWWRRWSKTLRFERSDQRGARRSGFALKAMTHHPTGAIAAAPTTSLPEVIGGSRNFDYRFAWVRDSSFTSRVFASLGCEAEADAFRAFIMRSAAGHADDLQIVYGVGGERRLGVNELGDLEGYRRSSPVRVGNQASGQRQLDAYGELVNLTWRWHQRGHSPDDDDWRFLVSLIDHAAEQWRAPDCGIWEWPGKPDHFVHSKVLCWSTLDRGIRLAEECMRRAPIRTWKRERDKLRKEIDRRGYDRRRGVYVQAFGRKMMDAALLLLPTVEFVDWRDERMIRTTQVIREELHAGEGLLYRYRRNDGLPGKEGAFLCCSFWLAECLVHQGELQDAQAVFDAALSAGNDLGLFSEQVDPDSGEMLGNFPQALTHLAHVSAALALEQAQRDL